MKTFSHFALVLLLAILPSVAKGQEKDSLAIHSFDTDSLQRLTESVIRYRVSRLIPSILDIPMEYLSPEQRRAKIERDAALRVSASMAMTFEAEKPPLLIQYIIKYSNYLFHNDYGLAGKAIPQRGGLYYIYIPAQPYRPDDSGH
jgi:hypothetical protein